MVKKLFLSLTLVLTACVTVNIYFPAAAVQRAADKIVEETWGGQGQEGGKETPKKAPGSGAAIAGRIYALVGFAREVHAQEPDINVSNPAIRTLKEAIKTRSESIKPFMDNGNIGINRDGLLAVRSTEGLNLKERAQVQQWVEAENRDRDTLYAEIARANNFPKEKIGDIKKIFAKSWIEQARSGWWIQDAQGSWKRK